MIAFCRWLAGFIAFAGCSSCFANVYTVGPGGGFAGCTHATVQAAVNAAAANPGPDEIRIAIGSTGYTNQAIVVNGQDLSLSGGFADCQPLAPVGRTRLSGAGGVAAAVLKIQSTGGTPVAVDLRGLELVDGDNTAIGASGGGLRIEDLVTVHLDDSRIAGNHAFYGAGVSIEGPLGAASTRLFVGGNVQIEDNSTVGAGSSGGGVDVRQAYLSLSGTGTVVRRNGAISEGGGIHVRGSAANRLASVDIVSGGAGSDGIVSGNSAAGTGGGLHVGNFSTVRLYTSDTAHPVSVSHNSADYGGGIYATSASASVLLWDGILDGNSGQQGGGALLADQGAHISMQPGGRDGAPAGSVACPANNPCNLLISNNDSNSRPGSVAMLRNSDPSAVSTIALASTIISANRGASLFAQRCATPAQPALCTSPASMSISNSRITSNVPAGGLVDVVYGATFICDLCTISQTGGASTEPLFIINGPLYLSRSIIWEPGRDVIGFETPAPLGAFALLLHDTADFPQQADIRTGDPRFAAPGVGNFHLAANSPALDSSSAIDAPDMDLDALARVVDQSGVPNRAGPMDLGAYERASDADLIFVVGFE
ncbi:MAG: hypothetical protein ABI411_17920 [Tahibacter sp.]